ncbi:hypothetical protein SSS_00351 [Sarcoptes scabiei]|nr:hypothetical protein SSS_00351 [Sarcoptes scabiei]
MKMLNELEIKSLYPLHYLIWLDEPLELQKYLSEHQDVKIEQKDHKQRTPLMLATILNHQECVRVLLDHNALVNVTDHTGFNVLHEAVTTVDPKLIRDVYLKKKAQRYSKEKIFSHLSRFVIILISTLR